MLYLYPKNTVDFTNNGDPIRHSFDEHVIRDDGFYLTFNLLLDKEEEYKKIKKEMIISAETPDGRNQFRVYDVKKKSTQVEIIAVQLMYDFDNKEVNPFSLKNASGAQIINRLKSSFKSTLGQFTMDSSVTESHDFTTNEEEDDTPSHNALEILNRITKRWDSELMLNGFDIRMIKRLGSKTDALLYEKKNISEFEDASSVSGMATRIHATSKFTPEGKEDEVTLSVTVDSPLINEYAQIYEKSYVNNDAKTEADLIAWVKLKYSTENIDKPSRTITVETNIIDGTEINYGDDLVMKYLVHDIDEVIRCVGYDYDPIKNTYYSVTLGDWKDSFATTLTGGIVDATNQQFNQIKNNITYISMSANGKNRNAYGPEPVPNPINGDNWYYYEFDRPDDVEYRVYQDGFWVKLDFFAAKKEVTEALDKADEAKQEAIDSYEKSITEAKAYTEQKANEFNGQLEMVRADVVETELKANSAVAKANQSIADVGFMQVDLNTTKQSAIDALTKAQTATDNLNTLSFNVDELTKTVGFKAEKTVVDNIKGTVDSHTTELSLHSQRIEARMTSTQVDSLVTAKGYVNQAQLTATSTAWNLQLNQVSTDLSNLEIGGRNLIINSNYFKDFIIYGNNAATFTENVLVPEWNAKDATRITTRGGTSSIKLYKTIIALPTPKEKNYVVAVWVKNNSNIKMVVSTNITSEFVEAGESKRVIVSSKGNDVSHLQLQLRTNSVADSMDITIWRAMAVEGNKIPADWSPAPEDLTTIEKTASLELRINGFQVEIADKINEAQFNVLAGQVTSVVTDIKSAAPKTSNQNLFIVNEATYGYWSGANFVEDQVTISSGYIDVKPLETITLSKYGSKGAARHHRVQYYDSNKKYITRGTMSFDANAVWSITIPSNCYYIIVSPNTEYPHAYDYKVEKGAGTGYSIAPEDKISKSQITQLSDFIDLRVQKGEVIGQITVEAGRTLIKNGQLVLDANTYIMGTTFANDIKAKSVDAVIADIATVRTKMLTADVISSIMLKSDTAMINKLFATTALVDTLTSKTAFINSVKAIDIAADRITTGTLNAAKVRLINLDFDTAVGNRTNFVKSAWNGINTSVSLDGSKMQFSGKYTSNWDGVSRVRDIDTILENGMLRIRNVPDHQTLYFSNNGISTMIDGSGLAESNEPTASGTIQFFDLRYGTTRGITVQSHMGSVALRTTGTYQNIVLDSSNEVDINLKSSENYLNVSGRIRSEGYTHKSGQVNAYIGAQEEVRITNRDLWNSGNTAYQRMRASIGYFNGVEANKYNDAYFFYIGAPSEVRVVDSFDNKGTYRPIRASDIHVNSVIANTVNDAANLYLGASSETRIVNTAGYNNGNPVYNRFRASVGYVNGIQVNRLNGGNFLYLGTPDEVRVVDGFDTNSTYRPIRATNFYQSSSREYKTNILSFDRSATDILNDLTVVEYNLKADLNEGINRKELGFIAEDSPAIATDDSKAINSYKTSALAVKAIQELSQRVENLEQEIKQLKGAA